MPVFIDRTAKDGTRMVLWRITESSEFFKEQLHINHEEKEFLKTLIPKRQKEWMSSRYLIQDVLGINMKAKLKKDVYGKPFLEQEQVHISISHSHDIAALIYSDKIVGIDVQLELNRITGIAKKFVNADEEKFIQEYDKVPYYHIIWGAKESMYKAYGRKNVDFKQEMNVNAFNWNGQPIKMNGQLKKETLFSFEIHAEKIDNYYLIYAISI